MTHVEKLIDKISRYHLLNNLIPGVLFLYLVNLLCIYSIDLSDILLMVFIGYFTGSVINRIGSVTIEPWFNKWKIVNYAPYPDYLKAEGIDEKIPTLLADNNMYRTFVAMFLLLLVLYIGHLIPIIDKFMHTDWAYLVTLSLLLFLYILAYRKQTSYIRKRVKKAINQPVE